MKAFLDFARLLWYALRSTSDGCHYVLRLVPTTDLKPCEDENKHKTPPNNLTQGLTKLFKQDGCHTNILIDAEAFAAGLADTQNCEEICVDAANKIEEYDVTDGKTTIDTTIPFEDYDASDVDSLVFLNGKEINSSSVPQSVQIVDNGGLVQLIFNEPIGAPDDPCDVKAIIWTKKVFNVVTCGTK